MALFGVKEIKDFAENHDDERVRIMYRMLVETRDKRALQHERIVALERVMREAADELKGKIDATST
jgi:hypothetical protein